MALTLTNIQARMSRTFKLLGLLDTNDKTDVLADALGEFVDRMDSPVISANLSITADETEYDKPSTIEKIKTVLDDNDNPVVYSEDEERGKIILQDAPSEDATFTVYGTTEDTRTNMSTIIAAIDERHERVLWAWIVAYAHEWAHSNQADAKFKRAEIITQKARGSRNRRIDLEMATVRQYDRRGYRIGDSANSEGLNVTIDNQFESDL